MTRALLRWSLRLVAAVLAVAVLLGITAVVIMNTERGTQWALGYALQKVPADVEIGEVHGTLWRGLQVTSLQYAGGNTRVVVSDIEVEVNWLASTLGQLRIRKLNAATLHIVSAGRSEEPMTEITVPPMPVTITVAALRLDELRIESGTEPKVIGDIRVRSARLEDNDVTLAELGLVFDRLAIQATGMRATLAGSLPIAGKVEWQWQDATWSGSALVDGSLADLGIDTTVSGPYPGRASGSVSILGQEQPQLLVTAAWDRWTFEKFSLLDGELSASGTANDYVVHGASARLVLDDRRIDIFASGRGNMTGLAHFEANVRDDVVTAELEGRLAWQPDVVMAATFAASATVAEHDLLADGSIDYGPAGLRCDGCNVRSGSNRIDFAGEFVEGVARADFDINAAALDEIVPGFEGTLIAAGSGQASGQDATALIRASTLTRPDIGAWRLDRTLQLDWSGGALTAGPHSWSGDYGQLQVVTLAVSAEDVDIGARLVEFPLRIAEDWLPDNVRVDGTANASADVQRRDGAWSGTVEWRQQGTALVVEEIGGQTTTIDVPQAQADVLLKGNRIDATAEVAVDPGVTASLQLALTDPGPDAHIDARLRAYGDDFAWLPALAPQVDRVDGTVTAELQASGPLADPVFGGSITIDKGRMLVPALNVPLDDLSLVLRGGSQGDLDLVASAKAGSGRLDVAGQVTDVMQPERALEVKITGDAAEVVNWPEYRVWASPALVITQRGGAWKLAGDVALPKAEVSLRSLPEGAVTVSPDVVVLGEEPVTDAQTRWSGEARLLLGDDVRFRALGLDTRLTGELRLRARPGRPTSVSGSVGLAEGTFEAFGLKLTIREGLLTYTGPIDDPIVDVTAIRVIETIDGTVTAGIRVSGRASELTTNVFAEPAMSDADALSYLVVGRPLNEATEAEGGDVSGAAVALGLKQASRLTQQIGQSVGLDQLGLTGDGGDTTALVAGKQVNSRLFARYTYGVFSRVGALLLRYRLTRALTLEAGVGETQSIDILYTIERD